MNRSVKLFLTAFSISFIGSMPIGTLNVSVAALMSGNHARDALWFGLGAVLVEMLLVRLSISVLNQAGKYRSVFTVLKVTACLLLFALAYKSFEAAIQEEALADIIPFSGSHPLLAGMLLSLLNPLHIPFWMGWTAVLRAKNLLVENQGGYLTYILAIGIGTGFSFILYGLVGNLLVDVLRSNRHIFNWVIGATLMLTGTIQTIKLIRKKPELRIS
jgi:threonine/homoserine/homoserine lactone efflux protein